MKILYIGVYREQSGWGRSCREYLSAMYNVGLNVVARPVLLQNSTAKIPSYIREMELKDSKNCDIVIQQLLPHHLDYNGHFKKNIAIFIAETNHLFRSKWSHLLSTMDEIWTSDNATNTTCKCSAIKKPTITIPIPCDIDKYHQDLVPYGNLPNTFKFYYIGELNPRKNIPALLQAFHTEFAPYEPVDLVLKAHVPGKSSEDNLIAMQKMCINIKKSLKMYPNLDSYKQEILIPNFLNDNDILRLHKTCDCFVMPSHWEGWCLPAFDAMAMGKTPICTKIGGMCDFIEEGGLLIDGQMSPMVDMNQTFCDIATGHESWKDINILKLRAAMRKIYQGQMIRSRLAENGINQAQKYSYINIGNIIKQKLGL